MQSMYSTAPADWATHKHLFTYARTHLYVLRFRWVNCPYFKLLIFSMYFICFLWGGIVCLFVFVFFLFCFLFLFFFFCFKFSQLNSKLESDKLCVENSSLTPPELWERHEVPLGIYAVTHNMKISKYFRCQSEDRFMLIKTKHTNYIMSFAVVTTEDEVIPTFIFPQGLRLNREAYIKCLGVKVLTWNERVAVRIHFV